MIQTKTLPIDAVHPYENNPRENDGAVDAVAASIREFGFKVPLVVTTDGEIICGHTRHKAAQKLGLKEIPCIIADDLTPEKIKAFRLADNRVGELAQWDIPALAVEIEELQALGVDDLADYGFDTSDGWWKQAAWKKAEKFCNLKIRVKCNGHDDFRSCTFFETNKKGKGTDIAKIKENPNNVPIFVNCFVDFLNKMFGENLKAGNFCVMTTPRRRHKTGLHFATEISRSVAKELGLNFYADAFSAKDRNRIEPEFLLETVPDEACVLILDDIVTTGETARACRRLLIDAGKVVFFVAAIRNNN